MARSERAGTPLARARRLHGVALAALFFSPVAACDAIAGLGQFQDVPCEPCEAGGAPFDDAPELPDGVGPIEASEDAGIDAFEAAVVDTGIDVVNTGTGVLPPSEAGPYAAFEWPRWIMPNGSEAGLPNPASYSPRSDGGVDDLITSLGWGNARTGVGSLSAAMTACAPPWRLPTRVELVSILDTSRMPVLANPAFGSIEAVPYWTASVAPSGSSWTVDFGTGAVGTSATGAAVICIYVGDAGAP